MKTFTSIIALALIFTVVVSGLHLRPVLTDCSDQQDDETNLDDQSGPGAGFDANTLMYREYNYDNSSVMQKRNLYSYLDFSHDYVIGLDEELAPNSDEQYSDFSESVEN